MRKLLRCDWSKSEQGHLSFGYLLSVQIRGRVPNYLNIRTITYTASFKGDDDDAGIQDLHLTQGLFIDSVPLQ